MEGSGYSMLVGGYKQSGGGGKEPIGAVFMRIMQPQLQNLCTKLTKNATPYATQRQKWATA
jgi:hypothetical protein